MTSPFNEGSARFSPDGRYVAYASDDSGVPEIFVRRFRAGHGARWPVSSGGGISPAWHAKGRELYFLSLDGTLMTVDVQLGAETFTAGRPRALFQTRVLARDITINYAGNLAVSPDGQQFLFDVPIDDPASQRINIEIGGPLAQGR